MLHSEATGSASRSVQRSAIRDHHHEVANGNCELAGIGVSCPLGLWVTAVVEVPVRVGRISLMNRLSSELRDNPERLHGDAIPPNAWDRARAWVESTPPHRNQPKPWRSAY